MKDKLIGFRASNLLHSRVHSKASDMGISITEFMRRAVEKELNEDNLHEAKSRELEEIEKVAKLCRAVLVQASSVRADLMITGKEKILSAAAIAINNGEVLRRRMELNDE